MQVSKGRIQQRASGDKQIDAISGSSTSSLTRQSKKGQNFSVARLFRQLSKRLSVYIFALSKRRKTFQKSRYPPGITKLNRINKVLQLKCKVPAPFPQILDGPAGRRSTELTVSAIDFCASVEQQLDDFSKPIKRRVVKSRSSRFIARMHELVVFVQNLPHLICVTQLYGFHQFV
jgi:hypothetical protein